MLRHDKAEEILYYGNEILCEVGYSGPALDFIIDMFNSAIVEVEKSVQHANNGYIHQMKEYEPWAQKLQQLQAIAAGRAEFK